MAVPDYLLRVIEQQEKLTLSLNTPEIIESTKLIAYYVAMIDAARVDPLDDETEQNELIKHFEDTLNKHVEHYEELVNNEL